MSMPLWTLAEIVAATGAEVDASPSPHSLTQGGEGQGEGRQREDREGITGVSIDTRSIAPGDLFVALKDVRDGHDFVGFAFEKHAAAALVKRKYTRQLGDRVLLRVDDPLKALEAIGIAARARLSPDARVIAVTGSAGKTTTKEMLRACLSAIAPGQTHASEKSYNNHWGVPLTLARMPRDTRYAIFEIGMNHAGEITPLTGMVRPHVAIVTTVAAVHLEHFASVEDIARAKAEIFTGLENVGTAILPADNPHLGILDEALRPGAGSLTFGIVKDADVQLSGSVTRLGTDIVARRDGGLVSYTLGMRGEHNISNSLAVLAALDSIGLDGAGAMAPLAHFTAPPGRGALIPLVIEGHQALLIDESYNANPASTIAALSVLGLTDDGIFARRIAVLGDMLELGAQSKALHEGLVPAIVSADVGVVLACGPQMRHLYDALPPAIQAKSVWKPSAAELIEPLLATVQGGDAVMIKGSNGMQLSSLVEALKKRHSAAGSPG